MFRHRLFDVHNFAASRTLKMLDVRNKEVAARLKTKLPFMTVQPTDKAFQNLHR